METMHPVEPHEVMVTPKSHKNELPLLISNSVGALTFRASIGGSFAPTVNRQHYPRACLKRSIQ